MSASSCSFVGCKVQKISKPKAIDNKHYCAVHFKQLSAKIKKETAPRCKHICLIGAVNGGQQCTSKAVNDGFCNRHSKSSTRNVFVIKEEVQLPESPCRGEEVKFWANIRVVVLDGVKYHLQKDTGLCVQKKPDGKILVLGAVLKKTGSPKAQFFSMDELPSEVRNWCKSSCLEVS